MHTKTKPEFVALTNDILFKDTFGLPSNIQFLEYLLEAYYNYPVGYLKGKLEVFYESTLEKTKYDDKGFRSDLKVIIDQHIICNIEMFSSFQVDSLTKSKQYTMRIYSTQLYVGDDCANIKKVTQINFIDHPSNDVKVMIDEEVKRTLYLGDEKTSEDISIDLVRLDLARNVEYNESDRFMRLLKFLGAETKEQRDTYAKGDEVLMGMNKWIDEYMSDDEWWRKYNDVYWSKREGICEGKAEGREERNIEIAKKMLAKGLDINEISEITELSIHEIKALQSETND